MEEEYPHDHYLTLVKNVFIMGDVELRDYKEYCEISGKFLIFFFRYMEKYAPYENQNVTLNNPFEYFRDLRQKEKISTRILQTILGKFHGKFITEIFLRMGTSSETIISSTI